MAKIEKMPGGLNKLTVDLYFQDSEIPMIEAFRKRTEERLREKGYLKDMQYTLDDVVFYIVGEVLSGRGRYLDVNAGYAFDH